jgi:hypothetical protein
LAAATIAGAWFRHQSLRLISKKMRERFFGEAAIPMREPTDCVASGMNTNHLKIRLWKDKGEVG